MPKTIVQNVAFRNTKVDTLYTMYLDAKHHSAITGGRTARISGVEGSTYSANGGGHSGKILLLIRNKLIVQSFFAADWPNGQVDSILVLSFVQRGRDAVIHMTHANLPDNQAVAIKQGWKDFYWNPWKKYVASLK